MVRENQDLLLKSQGILQNSGCGNHEKIEERRNNLKEKEEK